MVLVLVLLLLLQVPIVDIGHETIPYNSNVNLKSYLSFRHGAGGKLETYDPISNLRNGIGFYAKNHHFMFIWGGNALNKFSKYRMYLCDDISFEHCIGDILVH